MPVSRRSAFDSALLVVAVASAIALVVALVLVLAVKATGAWPLVAAALLVTSLTIWSTRPGVSGIRRSER